MQIQPAHLAAHAADVLIQQYVCMHAVQACVYVHMRVYCLYRMDFTRVHHTLSQSDFGNVFLLADKLNMLLQAGAGGGGGGGDPGQRES